MADDDGDPSRPSVHPWTFIVIPLFIIIVSGFTYAMVRRSRRHGTLLRADWPQSRAGDPYGYLGRGLGGHRTRAGHGPGGGRYAPWRVARSQEGLNELGEAPPAYDGKREDDTELRDMGHYMRDLEAGTARPPAYPTQPEPVAHRDRQGG
ncbi:hypothetical protein ACO1O0_002000 [Amphichorda felina]